MVSRSPRFTTPTVVSGASDTIPGLITTVCLDLQNHKYPCDEKLVASSVNRWGQTKSTAQYQSLLLDYYDNKAYIPTARGLYKESRLSQSESYTRAMKILIQNNIIPFTVKEGSPPSEGTRASFEAFLPADLQFADRLCQNINVSDGYLAFCIMEKQIAPKTPGVVAAGATFSSEIAGIYKGRQTGRIVSTGTPVDKTIAATPKIVLCVIDTIKDRSGLTQKIATSLSGTI
jgi:hypothetical protein